MKNNNVGERKRRHGEGEKKRSRKSMNAVVVPWAADVFPFSSKIPVIFA